MFYHSMQGMNIIVDGFQCSYIKGVKGGYKSNMFCNVMLMWWNTIPKNSEVTWIENKLWHVNIKTWRNHSPERIIPQ